MVFVFLFWLTLLDMIISRSRWHYFVLFVAEWYSIVYICHTFIHSSVSGPWACFHVLAILIVLLWTLGCSYLFELEFSSFLDIYPGVGLLDDIVVLILVFLRNLLTVLFKGHTNLHSHQQPTNSEGEFCFSISFPSFFHVKFSFSLRLENVVDRVMTLQIGTGLNSKTYKYSRQSGSRPQVKMALGSAIGGMTSPWELPESCSTVNTLI